MSAIRDTKHAAGIAGLAFLAAILTVPVAYVTGHLREYGPAIREVIHWMLVPQFVMGMFAAGLLIGVCVLAMLWEESR